MGFRQKESFSSAKGFHISISKSGIGYSWKTKDFRTTNNTNTPQPKPESRKINAEVIAVPNTDATKFISTDLGVLIHAIQKCIMYNGFGTILIWISLIAFIFIPVIFSSETIFSSRSFLLAILVISILIKLIIKFKYRVSLDYEFDEDSCAEVSNRVTKLKSIIKSKKMWRVLEINKVTNPKYAGGANENMRRIPCYGYNFPPSIIKTNVECVTLSDGKENFVFLPDKLYIIRGITVGSLNYNDIRFDIGTLQFQEKNGIPKDTDIVGHTWQYVNKSGGPDKRFKINPEIPIVLYGELQLKSNNGLNVRIHYSNPNINQS